MSNDIFDRVRLKHDYAYIIIDDNMDKRALEVLKELKKNPKFNTKTIVMIDKSLTIIKDNLIKDGFNDYIFKENINEELERVLNQNSFLYSINSLGKNNIGDCMNNIIFMALKGSIAVIYLFLVIKALGKKQISELNIFDYIIGLSLGNIAAEMTVNDDITIIEGLLSMTVYGIFSLFVSFITEKSIYARRLITGEPVIIMENGKISREQLKKCKIDINDLLQDARESGYFNISEINYAVMEPSGKISFLPKNKFHPITPNDMKVKVSDGGIIANLILDGILMEENIKSIGHDKEWLIKRLTKEGYNNIEELLLVTCDNKEKLTIYKNDELIDYKVLE